MFQKWSRKQIWGTEGKRGSKKWSRKENWETKMDLKYGYGNKMRFQIKYYEFSPSLPEETLYVWMGSSSRSWPGLRIFKDLFVRLEVVFPPLSILGYVIR